MAAGERGEPAATDSTRRQLQTLRWAASPAPRPGHWRPATRVESCHGTPRPTAWHLAPPGCDRAGDSVRGPQGPRVDWRYGQRRHARQLGRGKDRRLRRREVRRRGTRQPRNTRTREVDLGGDGSTKLLRPRERLQIRERRTRRGRAQHPSFPGRPRNLPGVVPKRRQVPANQCGPSTLLLVETGVVCPTCTCLATVPKSAAYPTSSARKVPRRR